MAPNILGNTLLLAETSIEKSSYDPDTKSPVKLSTDYEPSLSSNITKKRDTSCKKVQVATHKFSSFFSNKNKFEIFPLFSLLSN